MEGGGEIEVMKNFHKKLANAAPYKPFFSTENVDRKLSLSLLCGVIEGAGYLINILVSCRYAPRSEQGSEHGKKLKIALTFKRGTRGFC